MYLFYALVFPEAQYKRKHMAHAVRVQKTETRDADVYVWRLKKKTTTTIKKCAGSTAPGKQWPKIGNFYVAWHIHCSPLLTVRLPGTTCNNRLSWPQIDSAKHVPLSYRHQKLTSLDRFSFLLLASNKLVSSVCCCCRWFSDAREFFQKKNGDKIDWILI